MFQIVLDRLRNGLKSYSEKWQWHITIQSCQKEVHVTTLSDLQWLQINDSLIKGNSGASGEKNWCNSWCSSWCKSWWSGWWSCWFSGRIHYFAVIVFYSSTIKWHSNTKVIIHGSFTWFVDHHFTCGQINSQWFVENCPDYIFVTAGSSQTTVISEQGC